MDEEGECDEMGSGATNSNADLESHSSDAPDGANGDAAFDSPVRVTFYHTRGRLADVDGLSGKAAIDGLVAAKILTDDSAKQVTEVRHCQTKGRPETTQIVIETIPQVRDWEEMDGL